MSVKQVQDCLVFGPGLSKAEASLAESILGLIQGSIRVKLTVFEELLQSGSQEGPELFGFLAQGCPKLRFTLKELVSGLIQGSIRVELRFFEKLLQSRCQSGPGLFGFWPRVV